MSNVNGINNVVSSILNMSNEEKSVMFMNLLSKSNEAVSNVVDVVRETVVTSENKQILDAVIKHAKTAVVNSYEASKEVAVISAVSTAAASVFTTKKVAEGSKALADVTAKKSKMFASWILAQ